MGTYRGSGTAGSGSVTSSPADQISVADTGDRFTATNVEDALSEIEDSLNDHISNTSDPHSVTATQVAVTDSGGNYSGTNVETVLAEISDNHIESTSNPHSVVASQVNITDSGAYYAASNVEAALAEIQTSPPKPSSVTNSAATYGKLLTADGNSDSAWGQLVWKDLKGVYRPDSGAATPPAATFIGTNIDERSYAAGDASDWVFHMPHDYAVGTDLYMHVHWGHNGTSISGTLQWDFEITYANRNASAPFDVFSTPITPTLSNSATINMTNYPQYCHVVEEFQLSAGTPSATQLDTDDMAVDGLILVHFEANTIPTIGGGIARPFVFSVDLHYQADIEGTKNKDPNYYT